MSQLIAIAFDDEQRADEVRTEMMRLQREHVVELEDAVVAIRKQNGDVKLRQLYNLTSTGAISGGFWGTLIGLIFMSPVLGLAVGAGVGAVGGALADIGIDDDFMKELGRRVQPGSSVLFVLVREMTSDRVLEALQPYEGHVMRTSLSHQDEEKLRQALEAVHAS
jgi:uncharacterized membrane protein